MQYGCDSSQNKFVLSQKSQRKKIPCLCVKVMVIVPVPGMEIRIYIFSGKSRCRVFVPVLYFCRIPWCLYRITGCRIIQCLGSRSWLQVNYDDYSFFILTEILLCSFLYLYLPLILRTHHGLMSPGWWHGLRWYLSFYLVFSDVNRYSCQCEYNAYFLDRLFEVLDYSTRNH